MDLTTRLLPRRDLSMVDEEEALPEKTPAGRRAPRLRQRVMEEIGWRRGRASNQLSVVSYQLSVISYQLSVNRKPVSCEAGLFVGYG